MVVKIISFAELLKTRGERGVGGDAIKKSNVHAVWTDPTLNPTAHPPTQTSGESEADRIRDGERRCQCSCGSQELNPIFPTDPTRDAAEARAIPIDDAGTVRAYEETGDLYANAKTDGRVDGPNSTDWHQKAADYHAHHFSCAACIASGLGQDHGERCCDGLLLWDEYQRDGADSLEAPNDISVEVNA